MDKWKKLTKDKAELKFFIGLTPTLRSEPRLFVGVGLMFF